MLPVRRPATCALTATLRMGKVGATGEQLLAPADVLALARRGPIA